MRDKIIVYLVAGVLVIGALWLFIGSGCVWWNQVHESWEYASRFRAKKVSDAAKEYRRLHHRWPSTVNELTTPDDNENGGKVWIDAERAVDIWGKPFQIAPPEDGSENVRVYTTSPAGKLISSDQPQDVTPP
jgi:hypothetical protein